VLERLSDLRIRCDVPDYIRSDNGPKITTCRVGDWRESVEVKALFNESGSPCLSKVQRGSRFRGAISRRDRHGGSLYRPMQ